ncbi:hypothetical protein [Sinomonas terrae]|uniref:Uncharacterized protein n=1 Tax=Sinomonas terrae TaxID=2908838 RepID=A0ABS9U7D1_9MICC|nr:hypothetical protein [Sinomonas terrae]MCH6472595.1 hypothetical protein [Sinomonas terrae]
MDIEQIEAAAQRKLEEDRHARVTSVKAYAEAAKRVADLRADLKAAERQHLAAHRQAVKLGWSEPDLKAFGIEAPTISVGGRPRKAKTSSESRPAKDTEEEPSVQPPTTADEPASPEG